MNQVEMNGNDDAAERGRVVVVGERQEDCSFIREGILRNGSSTASGSVGRDNTSNYATTKSDDDEIWNVETKYYTAEVLMRIREAEKLLSCSEEMDDLKSADGVVLVFNAQDEGSFERAISLVTPIMDRQLEELDEEEDDFLKADIRLAAGIVPVNPNGDENNRAIAGGEREASTGCSASAITSTIPGYPTEWIDKCRDSGFELVFVFQSIVEGVRCETKLQSSQDDSVIMPSQSMLSDREYIKEAGPEYVGMEDILDCCGGLKRVIDALHAHMWPGLIMKDREDSSEAIITNSLDESKDRPSESTIASNSNELVDREDYKELPSSTSDTAAAASDGHDLEDFDEEDLETQMAAFEKLMVQMSRAREDAAQMSDKERRDFAAEMAMKMLSELGNGDLESGSL